MMHKGKKKNEASSQMESLSMEIIQKYLYLCLSHEHLDI